MPHAARMTGEDLNAAKTGGSKPKVPHDFAGRGP